MTALSGGVFDTDQTVGDHSELRSLVDDLARRSFDARLGRRGLPDEFDTGLWRALQDTGLARLTSTADSGAGPAELAVTLYGVARHAGAVPLVETDVLAGWLAGVANIALPDGPLTVAVADAAATDGRVIGTAIDVPWTDACEAVLLAARSGDGLRVGILDIGRATVYSGHNLAGEPRDRIEFDMAAADLTIVDPALGAELRIRGAWSRCVQIVGVLDAAAASSVQHTRTREQFGRALSAFQSVQQSLAAMAGEIELGRAAVELAVVAACDFGFGSAQVDYATAVAKVTVGRAVEAVTSIAHQLHGAIGVTAEHPLWLSTTRAQSWIGDYGKPAEYARYLGHLALDTAQPWALVTGNQISAKVVHQQEDL